MEVLAGARTNEREADLRRLLQRFDLLRFDIAARDFHATARIYRSLSTSGHHAPGPDRLLIASVAVRP